MTSPLHLGRQVVYCGHLARLCLEERMRQFGVTPVQAYAMRFLARGEEAREITQRDLERELRLKAPTVNGVVDRLEEKGFLVRQPSPTDGRCRLLRLTDTGREAAAAFLSAMEDTEALFRSALTDREQQIFQELLSRIVTNLEGEVHRT